MNVFLAVSDAASDRLFFALAGFVLVATQVLSQWWSSRKLNAIAATGEKTHTLVNSAMGAQLKLGAELSRWKADREPSEENKIAADKAEQLFREHQGKQDRVDASAKAP